MTLRPDVSELMRQEIERGLAHVPPLYAPGLARYLFDRVRPGGFLLAVLHNDLAEAVNRMNPGSLEALRSLVLFLHDFAPANSWGSSALVEAWLADPEARTA